MDNRMSSPVWHPFTQHGLGQPTVSIAHAEGTCLTTSDGTRLIDAISSWWVTTHGHRHPAIVAAITEEVERLDQIIFAGFTHEPAERLARELVGLAPAGLAHVFYSDSGSTAVEVGIKMALGFWRNRGEARSRLAALEHGYHGDTVGTMSMGARGVFSASYAPLLFDVTRIPFPYEGREQSTLDALEAACRHGDLAALLIEPLLLGAGGMLTYSSMTLAAMAEICARYRVLLIADEVMTGWGRTGTLFACEQAGVTPDILCMAKGLTGGSLPLAATLCTADIFDAHRCEDRARMLFHSSSYTANPIACAAALANVTVWRDEPVRARIAALAERQAEALRRFAGNPRIAAVRQCGTVTALDLRTDGRGDGGYLAGVAPELARYFLTRGVLLRPLGTTIYVMPPYCITADELDHVYRAIDSAAYVYGTDR